MRQRLLLVFCLCVSLDAISSDDNLGIPFELYRDITPRMENHMEKNMNNEMRTSDYIQGL